MDTKITLLTIALLMCIGPVCAQVGAKSVAAAPAVGTEQDNPEAVEPVAVLLGQDARAAGVQLLGRELADEYVLLTKLLNYHWNVTGPFFGPLHSLFGTQYEQAFKTVDLVAERIRALEGTPAGSMAEFLKLARLVEAPGKQVRDTQMIKDLLQDHEMIAKNLRADVVELQKLGDGATANMLEELIIQHDKSAWMLRSLLVTQEGGKAPSSDLK
jgi:starvation-inducible DNA-binding protein